MSTVGDLALGTLAAASTVLSVTMILSPLAGFIAIFLIPLSSVAFARVFMGIIDD